MKRDMTNKTMTRQSGESPRCWQGVGKVLAYSMSMARVCLEYAYSMPKVWIEYASGLFLFPHWEQNISTPGTKHSLAGNKTARRLVVSLLLLMVMGITGAWGQTWPDGIYYLKSNVNATPNWYLWPSVVTNTTGGNRYLTTYHGTEATATANYAAHDNTWCHWVVKNVTVDGNQYIQLINPKLDKYVIIRDKAFGDRDVWLADVPTDDVTRSYFQLTNQSGVYYCISPTRAYAGNETNYGSRSFNSATGDKNGLGSGDGTALTDQRDGLIQLFNGDPKWTIESHRLSAPTITYNADRSFSFSYDQILAGFDILYTMNGNDPTIGGTGVETYTGGNIYASSSCTVKAVVARYGVVLTEVASQEVDPPGTPPDPVIAVSDPCTNTITITDTGHIYYTTDGSDPSSSNGTLYTGPFQQNTNCTIKAIAYYGTTPSDNVATYSHTAKTAMPTITVNGNLVTITGNGDIYYTTDGSEPMTSSTTYSAPLTLENGTGTLTIKAVAKDGELALSCVAEATARLAQFISNVTDLNGITASDNCMVVADFDASGYTGSINNFSGTFDGGFHTISGLIHPLFNSVDGGTVKNVILKDVSISTGTNVGAICNEAKGTAKIYNCGVLSGSVTGSGAVGSIVGILTSGSTARVINCYSYADVRGGKYAGGIVGRNNSWSEGVLRGRIAMCMMYGNLSGGTEDNGSSPVYAGGHVNNVQKFTEYNYWRSKADITYTKYNDQLAIDKDEYLTRFPFYRHILNTHRELAAYFLFGSSGQTVGDITAAQVDEIGHWVLNTDIAPYPIIEAWGENTKKITEEIANNLPLTSDDYKGRQLTEMGSSGFLRVNVSINGSTYSSELPITDMNEDKFDYTWGKVVLPFANEYSGWPRVYSKVCTGWKITNITGGTAGTYANYNMADRECTAKDKYVNSNYIFAQGGYYVVPYGVTAIDIEANFANAFYLSDPSYEIGYDASFANATELGGSVPTTYHEQTVYTSLSDLVGQLTTTNNPHDQAIVLVGNYHYRVTDDNTVYLNTGKAVTIMSCDEDNNQEPDYGWYQGNTYGRLEVPALRFDFVPLIEMGMSSRVTNSSYYPAIGIWHARGWFELTETCVSQMYQCEINDYDFANTDNGKGNNRWIANSGIFTQIIRARDGNCTKLSYLQIGGNAYVQELYPGSHSDKAQTCTAAPIVVTGGEIEECYMTGYKAGGKVSGDMIRFWCTGGKMHKWLGAYLEEPQTAGLTAKIDHALIGRFFGGGTSSAARIKGDIDITINNSLVDFYCGGPEFGDMYAGKTVTTHATNTTFGEYYGAGFGGTSITYNREAQQSSVGISAATTTFPILFTNYTDNRLTYKSDYGIGTCYKMEYIFHSNGYQAVARFYTGYAQFSLATTGNVTNILNNCRIKKLEALQTVLGKEATSGDFYGAGCQGKVDGAVTSTLTGCTIEGSAYGGGYKAESNNLDVYPTTEPNYSVYTKETGIFSDFGTVTPDTYTWAQGTSDINNTVEGTFLYTGTDVTMSDLGNVTGAISLTIHDGSVTKDVYGGGNESKSLNNTTVTLEGNANIGGNVFGGGNMADVSGSATVNIQE